MNKKILIWDLPLRLFHWLLVLTILGCWATHELGSDYIDWHMYLGYSAMALVIFRVTWGFIGTRHAKFVNFLQGPSKIKQYLSNGEPSAGHNPLGSLMVVCMLLLIALQTISGLFVDDEVFTTGPYFNALGDAVDDLMNSIHHNGFDILSVAIVLHVAAIIFYQRIKKHNLVKPMITGYKSSLSVDESQGISHSKLGLAIVVALLSAAFVYWLVVLNAPPPSDDFY